MTSSFPGGLGPGKESAVMADLHVPLTPEETEVLRELLESAAGDIQPEIHHTRTPEYKDGLRHRREVYRQLIRKFDDLAQA